jgi:hypothetical protein
VSRLPPMAMAMAVADGIVYAGSALGSQSASGGVVALDGATGARRWSARVGAPVGALVVTAGVVAGCWDNLISVGQPLMFGLNAVDGRVLWQRDLGAVLPIIAAADGLVFALDLASGGLLSAGVLGADRPAAVELPGRGPAKEASGKQRRPVCRRGWPKFWFCALRAAGVVRHRSACESWIKCSRGDSQLTYTTPCRPHHRVHAG